MSRASRTAALALLATSLAPAAAVAEVHLRLRPELRAGGGYASDMFLGAQLGPSAEAQIAPKLKLDASLSPQVKAWAEYDLGLGLYQGTGSTSFDNVLETGARVRLARSLFAELSAAGTLQRLATARSVDESLGLEASRSMGANVAPGLRYSTADLLLEALYMLTAREHLLDGGERVDDLSHAAVFSAGGSLGPTWATVAARLQRESSSIPEFSYSGASLHGSVAFAPLEALVLKLSAAGFRNGFESGRSDWLLRLGLAPTWRFNETFSLEASYGFALNRSSNTDFDAVRHFGYLGVRVEGELWRR